MTIRGYKFVGSTLPEVWFEKVNMVIEKTKESKAEFFKRVIENEVAIVEGRNEDVKTMQQSVLEKKMDLLLSKNNETIGLLMGVNSKTERNFGAISYAMKMIFRSMYYISRLLYVVGNFKESTIAEIHEMSAESTSLSFERYIQKVKNESAKDVIEYLHKQ